LKVVVANGKRKITKCKSPKDQSGSISKRTAKKFKLVKTNKRMKKNKNSKKEKTTCKTIKQEAAEIPEFATTLSKLAFLHI
jgi:hypothetical protein